jgi:hypothetical protein
VINCLDLRSETRVLTFQLWKCVQGKRTRRPKTSTKVKLSPMDIPEIDFRDKCNAWRSKSSSGPDIALYSYFSFGILDWRDNSQQALP